MKRITLMIMLLLVIVGVSTARDLKIGIVDSQAILANYDEYKNAMAILQEEKDEWDRRIQDLEKKIQDLQEQYQAQSTMMSEDWKRQKEAELQQTMTEYQNLQKEIYQEPDGKIYQRTTQLTAPIIDKINEAIAKVAQESGFDIILDNSASPMSLVVYLSDDAQDVNISEKVLESLKTVN